jgi:hypothetical protein
MKSALRLLPILAFATAAPGADLRIAMLGLDTSHTVSFAKLLNDPANPGHVAGARIVTGWKGGSPDVPDSAGRVEGFAATLAGTYGVRICGTIEEAVRGADAIMIENVDGRPHLAEARQVLPLRKPVFIDKPMAGSLRDGIEIFRLARKYGTPCFSSSDERFSGDIAGLKQARIGRMLGVFCYGPCELEPHVPDLFWYGIHAVEKCYALAGPGCRTVVRTSTPDADIVTGVWSDGRTVTVRGNRHSRHTYGTILFGTDAIVEGKPAPGYGPMLRELVKFFRTGVEPVTPRETVEILAFMEAADASKRQGGAPVLLEEVLRASGGEDGI